MPTYTFYVYSPAVLAYNTGTNAHDFAAGYDHWQDRYRIEVTDDDGTMNLSGDANQVATVYDLDGNVLDSGAIRVPYYAELDDGAGGSIYIDRIEVDGVHWGYVTSEPLTPGQSYPHLMVGSMSDSHTYYQTNSVACFAPGSRILTVEGEVPIEVLQPGHRVMTLDHGPQVLRWTGRWAGRVGDTRGTWPVTFCGPVPGIGVPARPLVLSAQHRVLLSGAWCELVMGAAEVLAPACGLRTPKRPVAPLTWHHLLFDRHEVIRANGLWVESLFLGDTLFDDMPPVQALSAMAALGSLRGHRETARMCLTRREAALFTAEAKAPPMPVQKPQTWVPSANMVADIAAGSATPTPSSRTD